MAIVYDKRNAALGDFFSSSAESVLTSAFSTIQIRTRLSPPVVMNLNSNAPPDPATQAMLQKVQPAVTFSGPAGTFTIAPYGTPDGVDPEIAKLGTALGLGVGCGVLGLMLLGKFIFRD